MANGHINGLALLIITGKQIKTTMNQHLTSIRMAITKSQMITSTSEDVEKQETFYIVGGKVN